MPEILKVIIIGIIEGITEWLPISSTGHMILAEQILKLKVSPEYWELFLVVIQLGAILAVIVLYFRRLWPFHRQDPKKSGIFRYVYRDRFYMWMMILISCLPAVIVGLFFNDWVDKHFYNYPTVAFMLIGYGVLFILVERRNEGKEPHIRSIASIDVLTALMIGLFQLLAIIPGTSRSGATIIGGLTLGMSRKTASEYTFFLAVPVMLGASLLKLVKFGFHFTGEEVLFLFVGMLTAFIVSILAIKFILQYIRSHDFKAFGIYRIALGIIVLLFFGIRGLMAA